MAAPTHGYESSVGSNGRTDGYDRFAPPTGISERAPLTAAVSAQGAGTSGGVPLDPYPAAHNPLAETARPGDHVGGAATVDGTAVDGASVRYWRPADGTLQFLPGRLEVIAGRDAGQEIRFVRTPGPDGTRVTFGRAEGAPYRHIQLREPTVSRAHARMTLESRTVQTSDGRSVGAPQWRLENLSATNPVVVNGRALSADGSNGAGVELQDGDRIEMGEVVFRFHAK